MKQNEPAASEQRKQINDNVTVEVMPKMPVFAMQRMPEFALAMAA